MSFSPADGLNFDFELGPWPVAVVGLPKWAFLLLLFYESQLQSCKQVLRQEHQVWWEHKERAPDLARESRNGFWEWEHLLRDKSQPVKRVWRALQAEGAAWTKAYERDHTPPWTQLDSVIVPGSEEQAETQVMPDPSLLSTWAMWMALLTLTPCKMSLKTVFLGNVSSDTVVSSVSSRLWTDPGIIETPGIWTPLS